MRFYFDVYENWKYGYDLLEEKFSFYKINIQMIFLPSVSMKPLSRCEFRFGINEDFFLLENKFKSFFESVCTIAEDLQFSSDKFSNSSKVNEPKCLIVVLFNNDRSEQRQMPIVIDLCCRRRAVNSDLTRSIVNAMGGLRIFVLFR